MEAGSIIELAPLVSDCILEAYWDSELKAYRLVAPSLDFGEFAEGTDWLYGSKLSGYVHARIPVLWPGSAGRQDRGIVTALGLLPKAALIHEQPTSVYVEAGTWGEPLVINEGAMSAVAVLERWIRQGTVSLEDIDVREIETLVEGLREECPALKLAVYRRLAIILKEAWGTGQLVDGRWVSVLPEASWVLPWEQFAVHLARIMKLLESPVPATGVPPANDATKGKPLPSLSVHFRGVHPWLAPAVCALSESDEASRGKLRRLIDALWHSDMRCFNRQSLDLIRLLDLARQFLEKHSNRGQRLDYEEFSRSKRAQLRASLLMNRRKAARDRLDRVSLIRNIAQACIVADTARFFSDSAKFLDRELLEGISKAKELIPDDPREFKKVSGDDAAWFHACLNAADVMRFLALVEWKLKGSAEPAAEALSLAEKYYETAAAMEIRSGLALSRWARKLMLEAALVAERDQSRGLGLCERALKLLEASRLDEESRFANAINKAKTLILMGRLGSLDARIEEVPKILDEVIADSDAKEYPQHLLTSYFMEIKRDSTAAIGLLDSVFAAKRASPDVRVIDFAASQRWLAAKLCAQLSEDAPREWVRASVERYLDVIKLQPNNIVALEEVLILLARHGIGIWEEWRDIMRLEPQEPGSPIVAAPGGLPRVALFLFLGAADGDADGELKPMDDAKWRDYAVRNFLLLDPAIGDERQWAQVLGQRDPKASWGMRGVLETLTKALVKRGRQAFRRIDMERADWLLRIAVSAWPDDAFLVSRRLEIGLVLDSEGGVENAMKATERFPEDDIVRFQAARVFLSARRESEAEKILLAACERSGGAASAHTAILDQLAALACRKQDWGEARRLYGYILDRNPMDPGGSFGLGRVCLEQGSEHWPDAFGFWLAALRTRSLDASPRSRVISWRTACSIANLLDAPSGAQTERALHMSLRSALAAESPEVAGILLDALSATGAVKETVAEAVLAGADRVTDIIVQRSVAQFLMARTVYCVLGSESGPPDILRYVQWARERGVLGDYLVGAKGSYGRALLRKGMQTPERQSISGGPAPHPMSGSQDWGSLCEHAATGGYVEGYYKTAYRLARALDDASSEDLAQAIPSLVEMVASRLTNGAEAESRVAQGLASVLGLRYVDGNLGIRSGRPMGCWVDLDLVRWSQRRWKGGPWEVCGSRIQRTVSEFPVVGDGLALSRGGIYFRREPDPDDPKSHRYYSYLELLAEPEAQSTDLDTASA